MGDIIQLKPLVFSVFYWIIIGVTVILIISAGFPPVLYPVSSDTRTTDYHSHIGELRKQSMNSTTDILPIMQDLLDFSGTISVTLRKNDIESAGSELIKYADRYRDLNNLIVRLDLNESEMADFSKDIQEQRELLTQFAHSSESLQSLEKLEIQYQNANDPDSLTSVRIQGRALKNRIQTLQNQYAEVSEKITTKGSSLGVDTSPVLESRKALDQMTGRVASGQAERDRLTRFIDSSAPYISFMMQPETGQYLDIISFFGFITGSQEGNRTIQVLLDAKPLLEIEPDEIGEFKRSIPIRNITAGDHIIHTQWGVVESKRNLLSVSPINTTISLSVKPIKGRTEVSLSGMLSSTGQTSDLPVSVLINDIIAEKVITRRDGGFQTVVVIEKGTWLLHAAFESSDYPVNASQSQVFEVSSDGERILSIKTSTSSPGYPPWLYIVPILILPVIPLWYLRRKGIIFEDKTIEPDITLNKGKNDDTGSLFTAGNSSYEELFVLSSTGDNATESAKQLYKQITCRISHMISVTNPDTLTPRELQEKIRGTPLIQYFRSFTCYYERIRYGGYSGRNEYKNLVSAAESINKAIIEEQDEN